MLILHRNPHFSVWIPRAPWKVCFLLGWQQGAILITENLRREMLLMLAGAICVGSVEGGIELFWDSMVDMRHFQRCVMCYTAG